MPAGRREAHTLYLSLSHLLSEGISDIAMMVKYVNGYYLYSCFRRHNVIIIYHQICPIKLVVNLTSMLLLVFKNPGVSSGTRLFWACLHMADQQGT